ncbi:hypothetical protein BRD19_04255 [Halobacteriales archaeon SW_7_65_23]|nr:MAG: hypothetical protein BRD19_04255 [Halobacteriales archaeon SW_7_65_23]
MTMSDQRLDGIGEELSASALSVLRLKRRVREIDTVEARELAERALDAPTRAEVESLLDEASNRTG